MSNEKAKTSTVVDTDTYFPASVDFLYSSAHVGNPVHDIRFLRVDQISTLRTQRWGGQYHILLFWVVSETVEDSVVNWFSVLLLRGSL